MGACSMSYVIVKLLFERCARRSDMLSEVRRTCTIAVRPISLLSQCVVVVVL